MVFEKVRSAIVAQLGCDPEKVTMDALLIDDMLSQIKTVDDIVKYIEEQTKA